MADDTDQVREYLRKIGRKGGEVTGSKKGFAALSPEEADRIRLKSARVRSAKAKKRAAKKKAAKKTARKK